MVANRFSRNTMIRWCFSEETEPDIGWKRLSAAIDGYRYVHSGLPRSAFAAEKTNSTLWPMSRADASVRRNAVKFAAT